MIDKLKLKPEVIFHTFTLPHVRSHRPGRCNLPSCNRIYIFYMVRCDVNVLQTELQTCPCRIQRFDAFLYCYMKINRLKRRINGISSVFFLRHIECALDESCLRFAGDLWLEIKSYVYAMDPRSYRTKNNHCFLRSLSQRKLLFHKKSKRLFEFCLRVLYKLVVARELEGPELN